jgi:hypothetical protein
VEGSNHTDVKFEAAPIPSPIISSYNFLMEWPWTYDYDFSWVLNGAKIISVDNGKTGIDTTNAWDLTSVTASVITSTRIQINVTWWIASAWDGIITLNLDNGWKLILNAKALRGS